MKMIIIKIHFMNFFRLDHFFFFFGFLIFMLAKGRGILSPSSAGSVILLIFLMILIFFFPYLFISCFTISIFSSVILGVKLIKICFKFGGLRTFICYKKWSLSLSKLLASMNSMLGHFFINWNSWSETLVNPPTFNVFSWGYPSGVLDRLIIP